MHKRYLCFICWVLIFIQSNYSQTKGYLIDQSFDLKVPFSITQFSTKDGLPQSQILDIIPKANGDLIIATALGILYYNGTEFKPFIKGEAYKAQAYYKIFWNEKYQRLFAKGNDGRPYLLYPEYKPIRDVNTFCIKGDSMYTIDDAGEIYGADLKALAFKKKISTGIINARNVFFGDHYFLISGNTGLFSFDLITKKKKLLSGVYYNFFKQSPYDSCIYGLSSREVSKISDVSCRTVFTLPEKNTSANCEQFDFTSRDEFYVATTHGLYEVHKAYTTAYSKKGELPSIFLKAIYYNSIENCLFVGTGEKGMLKLHFKNCYSFYTDQGFDENTSLSSVIKTKAGALLLADPNGVIYQLNMDTVIKKIKITPHISSLAEIDGSLYIGTWRRGIMIMKDGLVADSITYPKNIPGGPVHACFKDSRGIIWIGTSNGIAIGTQPKNIHPVLKDTIKKTVITFYETKNGTICIGGSDGISLADRNLKLIAHFGKKDGITGKEIRCFYEDSLGRLWFGSYGGGLYCYYKNRITSINKMTNARINDDVFCIAKEDGGSLYMTSNHGLWRVKEKDLSDFYEGKLNYLIPFHYEEEAGILNTEFNGGFQNNYLKTKFNHFYFPTLQGLVVLMPEALSLRKLHPIINKVLINDTDYCGNQHVFDRETFSVEFQFSTTSYLSKYNVYYQYKLDGENATKWSPLSKELSVTYKLIPPGSYTFSVRAVDAYNDPLPNVCTYRFEIRPYFYERLWFKVVSLFLFVLITIITVRFRFQNYRRKVEERERTQRQMAELKLQAIQSQMNPHFVFNSLNSIKYYLSINDQKNADLYIDHFSKLLRNFLETGSKSFITVEKEMQIITSYLELEKQRMNPSFDFSIRVAEKIEQLLIPTHLIQPFVENAIKHGINHSSKKCKLDITLIYENDAIVCTIEDDGIGRQKSREINKHRPYGHKSKGMEIVSEKIRIIKEIYGIHIVLSTEDKFDTVPVKTGTGTKVTLIIPTKENENSYR